MRTNYLPFIRFAISFFCFNLFYFTTYSQVGIGTTNPDANAKLDITSTAAEPGGLLLPRMALTAINSPSPLVNPVPAGMTVYNTATAGAGVNQVTPGFYYYDGARWVRLAGSAQAENNWSLIGNADTTPGTNFLGTTDNQNLIFSTNSSERVRVLANGQVVVNDIFPFDNVLFNSFATGINDAIGAGATNGFGVYGQATGSGVGVAGYSNNALAFGMRAANLNNSGVGLLASGAGWNGVYLPTTGISTVGDNGIFSLAGAGNGSGVIGTGNNSSHIVTHVNGGGVAGSGTRNGVFGYAGNGARINSNRGNAAGVFVLDSDNNVNTGNDNGMRASAVIAGFDNIAFYDGSNNHPAYDSYFGGYFSGGTEQVLTNYSPSYAYVGLRYNTTVNGRSGTDFKIVGPGNVATLINDDQNVPRIMFAPEAPEIVFQDYGVGHLVNGEARILLDPILKHSLHIDKQHPLKVFVTLEGDCNGVYVTNKSADGFTVKELQNGRSSVPFSWQIVANRADTKDENGNVVSKHVGLRLPIGPGPITTKAKQLEVKSLDKKDTLKEQKDVSTGKEFNMSVGDKEKPNTSEVQSNTSKGETNSPNTISEILKTRE